MEEFARMVEGKQFFANIRNIAQELKRANDLKESEIKLRESELRLMEIEVKLKLMPPGTVDLENLLNTGSLVNQGK